MSITVYIDIIDFNRKKVRAEREAMNVSILQGYVQRVEKANPSLKSKDVRHIKRILGI